MPRYNADGHRLDIGGNTILVVMRMAMCHGATRIELDPEQYDHFVKETRGHAAVQMARDGILLDSTCKIVKGNPSFTESGEPHALESHR